MNLSHRQQKIQEKRKQTPWRDFVMEICSWMPLNLYKNQDLITRYPPTGREGKIITTKQYEHNDDIQQEDLYAGDFLLNYSKLFIQSSKASLPQWYENENCYFSDSVYGAKNAYLCFGVGINGENIGYSVKCDRNIFHVYNSFFVSYNGQYVFQSKIITNSFNIFYSSNIHNSDNIWFGTNLMGCHECIRCNDLDNQSYMIDNTLYEKDQYFKEKEKILQQKHQFDIRHSKTIPLYNYASENCKGSAIIHSHDCNDCYAINNMKDSHNVIMSIGGESVESPKPAENCYDCINMGGTVNHFYGIVDSGTLSEHMYSCFGIGKGTYMYYCMLCESCSFCLGCIGLKNKSYYIFNKQYSKEEWYTKVDEIFGQMDRDGTLGQFFPPSMNPFYFNDTAAYLIDPSFTKKEVTAKGYLRRDEPIKVDIPADAKVVKLSELEQFEKFDEQGNRTINPEILKVIIQDEQGNIYKIVKMEYDFLMKHGLPLPRKHWLDRMKGNFRIN